jgi:hypothetical protein
MAHCLPARFPARRLPAREFHEAGGTPALPGFCLMAPMTGGYSAGALADSGFSASVFWSRTDIVHSVLASGSLIFLGSLESARWARLCLPRLALSPPPPPTHTHHHHHHHHHTHGTIRLPVSG